MNRLFQTEMKNKYREGNEAIARFMLSFSFFKFKHYHNSWVYLLPVIARIIDRLDNYEGGSEKWFKEISIMMADNNIEQAYNKVLEYVLSKED